MVFIWLSCYLYIYMDLNIVNNVTLLKANLAGNRGKSMCIIMHCEIVMGHIKERSTLNFISQSKLSI